MQVCLDLGFLTFWGEGGAPAMEDVTMEEQIDFRPPFPTEHVGAFQRHTRRLEPAGACIVLEGRPVFRVRGLSFDRLNMPHCAAIS
jgi:hypothetical protein